MDEKKATKNELVMKDARQEVDVEEVDDEEVDLQEVDGEEGHQEG